MHCTCPSIWDERAKPRKVQNSQKRGKLAHTVHRQIEEQIAMAESKSKEGMQLSKAEEDLMNHGLDILLEDCVSLTPEIWEGMLACTEKGIGRNLTSEEEHRFHK